MEKVEFTKENLISNGFKQVGPSNVTVFYYPEDYQDHVVEKVVDESAGLGRVPIGTVVMVAPNGDGREISWTKFPEIHETYRQFADDLPSLLDQVGDVAEWKAHRVRTNRASP